MSTTTVDSIEPARLLEMVPVSNRAVRTERQGRALVIYVPLRRRWWMRRPFRWVFPYRQERGYALDQLGQEVWRACNGRRNIERIVERFAKRHGVGFHEARAMVLQFLQTLLQRNLVVLVMPEGAEAQRKGAA